MLVLTRRPSESILIGDDIRVTLVSVKGKQVRIGIVANDDVSIIREELLEVTDFNSVETAKTVGV